MAVRTIEQLKSFFRRGMYPTEQNFADLCESFVHRAEKLGITTSPSEVLVKNHSSSEYIPLPAATTERAGVMSAEDKGKVEHIRDVETIAIAAIKKIDTEQFGGTLGLYIERGEDDYTLPLPLATTSTAGVMSASDKSRLNTLMEDGVRDLRLETNPSNGVVYLQYAGPEGPIDIVLPTVTPSTNGLMSAADKSKVDKIDAIETTAKGAFAYVYSEASASDFLATFSDNNETVEKEMHIPAATQTKAGVMAAADKYKLDSSIPSYTYSRTRTIRKGRWLQLAQWDGTAASSTTFLLTLCHRLFTASIQFSVDLSDARGNIDVGIASGNLPFIDRIAVVTLDGGKALVVRSCENLTNAAAQPTLRLDTTGEGWKSIATNILIDAAEPAESSYIASVTPVFRKFSDVVTSPATNLTDGLMAAADKRKLDAIATYSQHFIASLNALAARVDKLEQGAAPAPMSFNAELTKARLSPSTMVIISAALTNAKGPITYKVYEPVSRVLLYEEKTNNTGSFDMFVEMSKFPNQRALVEAVDASGQFAEIYLDIANM